MNLFKTISPSISLLLILSACHCMEEDATIAPDSDKNISLVATSTTQWTGIAISNDSRLFANYPNWSDKHTFSVTEITDTTDAAPYPDISWNTWQSEMEPSSHFICVQSVFIDKNNILWILDAANIQRNGEYLGVVKGGAKLIKIDLRSNTVVQKIIFDEPVIKSTSYLNDMRIDEDNSLAYITDSNEGAIILVDLQTAEARRIFDKDPSTKSENKIIVINNESWRNADGKYPIVHADGIALTPDKTQLYWRALTGQSLYKIATPLLRNPKLSDADLRKEVKRVASYLPPSDGIIFGSNGTLYLTSLEEKAIRTYDTTSNASRIIKKTEGFEWPDSFTISTDGYVYVSTSQINIPNPTEPYKIYKFKIP